MGDQAHGAPVAGKAPKAQAALLSHLSLTLSEGEMAVITVRPGTHATEPPPPFGRDVNLADRAYLPSGLQILAHAWDVLCAEGLLERQEGAAVRISELSNGHLFVCQGKEGKRIPFYVCFGSMIDTLNHEIDKLRCDLLVIAPPQRGRLRNIVLGDTTRKLVLDLHASMLVVRGGDADSCGGGKRAGPNDGGTATSGPRVPRSIESRREKTASGSERRADHGWSVRPSR